VSCNFAGSKKVVPSVKAPRIRRSGQRGHGILVRNKGPGRLDDHLGEVIEDLGFARRHVDSDPD
jgi:hypothetical protein